jgi:hypothetical protein
VKFPGPTRQMCPNALLEAGHESQRAFLDPRKKARGSPGRQQGGFVDQEVLKRLALLPLREFRNPHLATMGAVESGSAWPRILRDMASSRDRSYSPGVVKRLPIHAATGFVTAFPIRDHLRDARPTVSACLVQLARKPCKRSASRISGVTISPFVSRMAGGEGIPTVDPFLRVGTQSGPQPNPRVPSVQ